MDSHSKKDLFNADSSLIDIDRLRKNISLNEQSYKERQKTRLYLLNIYSSMMTNTVETNLSRSSKNSLQ